MASTAGALTTSSIVSDDVDSDFIPLDTMPTGRLTDVVNCLDTKHPAVVNLDACIPPGDIVVLKTILMKIEQVKSVKTLSLRFNNLGEVGGRILVDWISKNDFIEVLYILGTGIDTPVKIAMEEAWKKNLRGHKIENMGYTLIRVAQDTNIQPSPSTTK